MQTNLKSLFAGKREAVEVPPKRGPGRPPRVREEAVEAPDVVVEALQSMPDQPEAYDERLGQRSRKRKYHTTEDEVFQAHLAALSEASGKLISELRMPACGVRNSSHEKR